MKQINNYIQEKLKLNKSVINKNHHTLFPKTRNELITIIREEIEKNGNKCNLNHIDVSEIKDMSGIFKKSNFNGDISKWDVSNVKWMDEMFYYSDFNSDISSWDVSNVKNMWCMFFKSVFNNDISEWKINPECDTHEMFYNCPIKEEYKPNLPQK